MKNATQMAFEWPFVNALARNLPPEVYARWEACRSGHTFQAFYSKEVIAYKLVDGVPKILKVLVCQAANINLRSGATSTWLDDFSGEHIKISHLPVEVAPSCFMWQLRHTTFDLYEHRGHTNVKFNLAYRTLLNPATPQPGVTYLLESATFRDKFSTN